MRAKVVGLVGLGWLVAACSLLVERGAEQCDSDGDCAGKGAAFAGRVCSNNLCVASTTGTEGGVDTGPGTDAPVNPDAFVGECTTNEQCIAKAGGAAAICRKDTQACVPLLNSDCDSVASTSPSGTELTGADAVRDDNTVVIGSLLSLKGSNGPKNLARVQAIDLAIAEIMAGAAGLPPAMGGTARRPIARLSCNDVEDQNPAPAKPAPVRSAEHLFAVGVPAVVGAGTSGLTTTVIPLLSKKGVFLIAPSATSPSLTSIDDDNLFWRTAPSDALQAIPLASRVQALAPDNGAKKVAILYKNDSYGQGLYGKMVAGVTRGGKSIADPSNAAFALLRQFDGAAADQSALLTEVYNFKPDVVSIIGTTEGVTKILAPLDKNWATSVTPSNTPRPVYVVSDGCKTKELTDAIATDEAGPNTNLRDRVSGTAPGRPNATTNAFYLRFEPKYTAAQSRTIGTAGAYDAAYVILYALAANPVRQPTGKTIADGVLKLVGGTTVLDVGPDGINDAFQKLGAGSSINLNGASSPLDFDMAGESPADIEVWCVGSIAAPTFATTPLYFDAQQSKMSGAFSCP